MSGFIGIINFDGQPVDPAMLKNRTDYISRIGPHGQKTCLLGQAGFGHALLKTTLESETEVQPIVVDERLMIVGDVRLDGRQDLINRLGRKAVYIPDTATDIQLVCHAWHKWQDRLTEYLEGDFSFAIWDLLQKKLFVARDQMGIRTFYYHRTANQLVFSNALNAVSRHPGLDRSLNPQTITDFLLFGHNLESDSTSFREIHQLRPAHCATITRDSMKERRYWHFPIEDPIHFKNDQELTERFNYLFEQAVTDRLRFPRVNIMVSAGMDSTSITAKALNAFNKHGLDHAIQLNTGQAGSAPDISEHEIVNKFATDLGLDLTTEVTPSSLQFELQENNAWPAPEVNWHYKDRVPARLLDRMTSFSPIALSGHGGDPIMRMNSSYMPLLAKQGKWLTFAREFALFYQMHGRRPPLGIQTFVGKKFRVNDNPTVPIWLNKSLVDTHNLKERIHRRFNTFQNSTAGKVSYRPEAIFDLQATYWQHVVPAHDSQVSGHPLEFRHPYFDLRLLKFMLRVVSSRWLYRKSILRHVMKNELPLYILERRKLVFDDGFKKQSLIVLQPDDWKNAKARVANLSEFVDGNVYNSLCDNLSRLRQSEVSQLLAPMFLANWCKNQEIFDG